MTEIKLIVKENVVKLMNSKSRYLKIPENQFNVVSHGDIAEVIKRENDEYIDLIYRFNKPKVSDPEKGRITKITTSTKKGKR